MPGTFDQLQAKGFKFVTVSELIAMGKPMPPKEPGTEGSSARRRARCHPDDATTGPCFFARPRPGESVDHGMVADLYLQFRSRTEAALASLLKLTADMQREPAMLDTLQNLLKDVREPLLFVVVGEVKAGKSSLLNALFGQEFCKVDVLPATDRI